jgi:hypothetical protein
VRRPHTLNHRLIVRHQLPEHVLRRNKILLIVLDPLQARDLPDRTDGGAADLANALGQNVDAALQRLRLLVKEEVIAAEERAADVPMKILGLDIDRKRIGQETVQRR